VKVWQPFHRQAVFVFFALNVSSARVNGQNIHWFCLKAGI